MEGQLGQHPLGELIREIANARLSGALRLMRERVKIAIYFEDGTLVFAASNLRAHRLLESLRRNGLVKDAQLNQLPPMASDDQVADMLMQRQLLSSEALDQIRARQVSHVLRVALLWTNGQWEFDSRVRLVDDLRVPVNVDRLLMQCVRHLPPGFVASRVNGTEGRFSRAKREGKEAALLPAEAFVLGRAEAPVTLSELTAVSGLSEEESFRTIYGLTLSGLLDRSDWPNALFGARSNASKPGIPGKPPSHTVSAVVDGVGSEGTAEESELPELFARLQRATDHYEVLNVGRLADAEEIKGAYHMLALRFHPDRFHKSRPELRRRVDSAFAHIAQAYETLSDSSLRATYDAKLTSKSSRSDAQKAAPSEESTPRGSAASEVGRAELSFRQGMAALKRNQRDEAIRLLAEAAMLEPREARYRARYGHALIGQTNTRRVAETELKAAISLEPGNSSHRVMLAELYKALGLRRRAQGEIERVLATDPKNQAARTFLASLKNKD